MPADNAITVDNVTKTYLLYQRPADRIKEAFHPFRKKYHRPFRALKDVAFRVGQGEFIGIIGRNGSGKSTLLQLLCGIIQPTSGSVTVYGQISALLELGAGFNPEFTGRENVFLNASILGLTHQQIADSYDDIVAFADIGDFIDQPVKIYSSGMYVRLAFAIAVNVHPEILIVDEALAVGDIFFQQKCIAHMEKAMADCTKVLVTHDMHAVANLCDRVLVLDEGRIVFEGSPLKGVEYYTKVLHNQLYKSESAQAAQPDPERLPTAADPIRWAEVPLDAKAGANEIRIMRVAVTSPTNEPVDVVSADDTIVLHLLVYLTADKENLIFGYTVKDRVGNAIFGENTCRRPFQPIALGAGSHHLKISVTWPEIKEDKYLITLGVGEGMEPLKHVVQCWAHNVLSLTCINPGRIVHALFNGPIEGFEATPIK